MLRGETPSQKKNIIVAGQPTPPQCTPLRR